MDLGLSSMQVDQPERGFSYSRQAPLDMRMDPGRDRSAADLVAEAPEAELAEIIRAYGEERYARPIARAIVRRRARGARSRPPGDLVEVVRSAVPTPALFAGGHPAKRVFQALRIAVNDELGSLERGLEAAFDLLAPGGRLAVISFHSLEDRHGQGASCAPAARAASARPTCRSAAAAAWPRRRCWRRRPCARARPSSTATRAPARRACAPCGGPGTSG